ncbi:MAG: discoidin domain-containing protein, partial [bacterium]|nr:discoidin domain-containing protein [bacterium]
YIRYWYCASSVLSGSSTTMKHKSEFRISNIETNRQKEKKQNFRFAVLLNYLFVSDFGFRICFYCFKIIFLFILLSYSQADLIYLRNGKIIEGEISETSPGVFMIKGKGGNFTISKNMLLRVLRRDETATPVNVIIEIGSVVKKEAAENLKKEVAALGFPNPEIIDEPPYYRIRVGPYRQETEAIAAAQILDAAKLLNAYPTGSRVFRLAPHLDNVREEMNIALTVNGALVTADSFLAGYPAENATDGNVIDLNSRWVSDSTRTPHWLEVDFGKPKPFTRIELYTGEAHSVDYILCDFALQYWAGSEWKDIENAAKKNNLVENPRFTFAEITATKVRLYVMKGSMVDNIARVYELKIFSTESKIPESEFDRTALFERAYQIRLIQPSNFPPREGGDQSGLLGIVTSKITEWYPISCLVTYRAQAPSVLSASILPDATDFWTDAAFRRELNLAPDDYHTTINFDTQRTPGYSNVQGNGDISFTLKAKAPSKPGIYQKTLRIGLLNPETRTSLMFQEIRFTLQVD